MQKLDKMHRDKLIEMSRMCVLAINGEADLDDCTMVRETWDINFPKFFTSGISCVVLDMQDAKTEYDNYYKQKKHEMDVLADMVYEIMNCSNAFDYNREAVKKFLRYTESDNARDLADESGSDEIKYKILKKIEAELLEQLPEGMQIFLAKIVTKTVFEGAWVKVKVEEKSAYYARRGFRC